MTKEETTTGRMYIPADVESLETLAASQQEFLARAPDGADEYEVAGPNRHGKKGKLQIVFFEVPENRQISHLSQVEISGPAGFSYNPDGGYSVWSRKSKGGTRVEWRRWHTSGPVKYKIFVHYWNL